MKLGLMLASCARRFPDREAVVCGARRLTFGALEVRANRLANALIAAGQKPGDRVLLYLPNSVELVEAIMAVARSGGLIVPVSTRLAPAEVAFLVADCEPSVLIFAPSFRATATASAANLASVILIATETPEAGEQGLEDMIAAASAAPPPPLPPDHDDLVIGYTSGTTGRPKGAIGGHNNLLLVHGHINSLIWGLTGDDRLLVTTPMAHRTGLARIANMLTLGLRLVVMPRFDAIEAVDLIERERVTVAGVVPTIARLMLPEIERRPEACATFRTMLATGEVFPVELKERLRKALPNLRLFTYYSQTEANFITCLGPDEQRTHPHSVGRPVPGVEVRIVDPDLNDVAGGQPGEALVRCGMPGAIMTMRAYYNRPEATKETILDGGWIRTGDICRFDGDGYLYFVDRLKDMIVSGGFNIYSKEVELALSSHDAVADSAVIGVPDETFGEAVMAFVEPAHGMAVSEHELIEHCRSSIARYKKPKFIRFVDALPRTSSGKVQKNQLRAAAARATEDRTPVDATGQ